MDMHGSEMHDTALLVVEADELQPGDTVTVDYTFPDSATDDQLEIACHTPGHYEAGMKAPITVTN
jgi:uncharacterized cupredoxin-like copper-binding protein